MNKLIAIAVATAFAFNVNAQSVQDGEKMINYGRFESAKKTLEPLAAKDPLANYNLGIAELELENNAAARSVFAKYPDDFHNQAGTARVLFQEGKKDEAAKVLLAIIDKAKKKDWEKYKAAADAITYTKGGNANDAIAWYKKVIEINGGDASTYIGLGDAYLKLSSGGGEAMNAYEKAVEKGTNNSLAYSKIGDLWYQAHSYDAALKSYGQAKDADPSNPLPYKSLADAYQRAGKYDMALTNIEKFQELSDKSIDDQITYANLLFLSKKYPEAQAKIQELIGKGVQKTYLYRLIAYSAYETKDYQKAMDNMRTFYSKQDPAKIIADDYIYTGKIMSAMSGVDTVHAKMYSDSADYYFNKVITADTSKDKTELYKSIAEGFKDAKEYNKASIWYGRIVADNPGTAALDYFYWGYYAYLAKDYTTAAKAFDGLKAKYPDEGSGYLWIGNVAAAVDDAAKTGGAVQPYKDWLAFNKNNYEHKQVDLMRAYQYLAYYYYNSSNEKDAMEYVNKILEIEPTNTFANQVKDFYAKPKNAKPATGGKSAGRK
ncbi:tetratricopeptide repeat protein [Taibaiella koreensis]|uniref:tetratricopeptide repeat protein n=1 Tax=Taibaiella koreensis TaxID=1268548 RepID=UPI0013C34914|nr:tetratricopeptide repeat protein [Taibaiella koreensis]